MGSIFSKANITSILGDYITVKRKRKREEIDENDDVIDNALRSPKRKKLESTTKYIYQSLFIEGNSSDITVYALGEEFKLHKIYLCQSPYFSSMFGGSWLESDRKYVSINIVDQLITINSLKIVFGSLYDGDIVINPMEVTSILATARMFQLDGLIEKCTEVMSEVINHKTALYYYQAACQYGDKKLRNKCYKWFLTNLMSYYYWQHCDELKNIPVSLMEKLISDPNLYVVQTETCVYTMLKYWVYLRLTQDEELCDHNRNKAKKYFKDLQGKTPFLLSEDGKAYRKVFKGLRLQNLILHEGDIGDIIEDNIIPKSWLESVVFMQWVNLLRISRNEDTGPVDVTEDEFLSKSQRFGRLITTNNRHKWRWTGFNYGIDLLMLIDGSTLSIKRNNRNEQEQMMNLQGPRTISIRVRVATLNDQLQTVCVKQTVILTLNLTQGSEVQLIKFNENEIKYPLLISVNVLYLKPLEINKTGNIGFPSTDQPQIAT